MTSATRSTVGVRTRGPMSLQARAITAFLRRMLADVRVGRLTLILPDMATIEASGALPGPHARLAILSWRALRGLWSGGDLDFAESYLRGEWRSSDLTSVLMFGALNVSCTFERQGLVWLRLVRRFVHFRQRNTRSQARRNIEAHYDLGNDFYAAWLDRGMSYSSALYEAPGQSLEAAQAAKQARIMALLAPEDGAHVLEIGCGWGGLAECLAQAGHRVTGLTLSPSQKRYAEMRLEEEGLGAACDIRLQDYRDVAGPFDGIVSIEMFEAVGEAYWPVFFQALRRNLKPGGSALLQIITIADDRFEAYRTTPDFIQLHIFPGGMLPSVSALHDQIEAAGLVLDHEERFGLSYAETLAAWARRFEAAWPSLDGTQFDEAFRRKWRYYLAYCEAGFRTGALDVGFYRLTNRMDGAA